MAAARHIVSQAQQFQAEVNEILKPHTMAQEAMAAVHADQQPTERPILIGLGGKLRAGKDALADRLVSNYGFEKLNMSDPLAKALYTLNPWIPTTELEIQDDGSSIGGFARYRDISDAIGYTETKKNLEARRLLQALGTEVGRDQISETIWTDIAARHIEEIRSQGVPVAITGIRYPNELEMIRAAGGIAIWMERPEVNPIVFGQPEQTEGAQLPTEAANIGQQVLDAIDGALDPARMHAHTSEITLSASDFDITVNNDGSLEELHAKAGALIESLTTATVGTVIDVDNIG